MVFVELLNFKREAWHASSGRNMPGMTPVCGLAAAYALLVLRQSFSNSAELEAAGFRGWDNGNACEGWTGVQCNADGRVTVL